MVEILHDKETLLSLVKSALNLVVEAKDKTAITLSDEEKQKIKHAEAFFNQLGGMVSVSFKKQLHNKKIVELIKEMTV